MQSIRQVQPGCGNIQTTLKNLENDKKISDKQEEILVICKKIPGCGKLHPLQDRKVFSDLKFKSVDLLNFVFKNEKLEKSFKDQVYIEVISIYNQVIKTLKNNKYDFTQDQLFFWKGREHYFKTGEVPDSFCQLLKTPAEPT